MNAADVLVAGPRIMVSVECNSSRSQLHVWKTEKHAVNNQMMIRFLNHNFTSLWRGCKLPVPLPIVQCVFEIVHASRVHASQESTQYTQQGKKRVSNAQLANFNLTKTRIIVCCVVALE